MFRTPLFLALAAFGVVSQLAFVRAQDKPKNVTSRDEKPVVSLKVGDWAPALTVNKWLQGDAVTKFEPGKVYVVDFWATWCGACIRSMPHLAELQGRYKDRGVIVISFTSRDIRESSNSEESVTAFVKKRGPRLGYRFAFGDNDTTFDAWMKAAGHHAMPGVFVVDGGGRIAYDGNPLFLELALQKVLAGNASAKSIGDEMAKIQAEYQSLCAPLDRDQKAFVESDPEPYYRALKEFEGKYPALADCLPAAGFKLMLLLKHGGADESKDYAERLLTRATEQKNVFLLQMLNVLLQDKKDVKQLAALAVRAAENLVHIDDGKNAYSLMRLADTYFACGDSAKAKECARKAIDAAAGESAEDRQQIEKEARKFGAGK